MPIDVILPALGMSQDTGKIVQWLKSEGEHVVQGEPLVEIETDKATVEIEVPADGVLARVSAAAGDDVPVGQVIALILSAGEALSQHETTGAGQPASKIEAANAGQPASKTEATSAAHAASKTEAASAAHNGSQNSTSSVATARPHTGSASAQAVPAAQMTARTTTLASALAARIAADNNVDLSLVKPSGKRIQKADVLTYLQNQEASATSASISTTHSPRLVLASPKARRLAAETGKDLVRMKGSGPDGAILAADVLAATTQTPLAISKQETSEPLLQDEEAVATSNGANDPALSTIWRIMAERTTQSWTTIPHFYLMRDVEVSRLKSWREHIMKQSAVKVTYTDLLVKIVATALRTHPRVNASWSAGKITLQPEIHIGLAVAIEDGLVVPVIHRADTLSLGEIAQQRVELVARAQAGKLRPQDISGGTFTISNLGMYNVDAFNAIINQPQAAILAVGRIAERVVAVHGQPTVRPMMVLTLSCDHRAVDGARGARFLDSVATLIDEPLGLLV